MDKTYTLFIIIHNSLLYKSNQYIPQYNQPLDRNYNYII